MQGFGVFLGVVVGMVMMKSSGRKMETHIILPHLSDRVLVGKVKPQSYAIYYSFTDRLVRSFSSEKAIWVEIESSSIQAYEDTAQRQL